MLHYHTYVVTNLKNYILHKILIENKYTHLVVVIDVVKSQYKLQKVNRILRMSLFQRYKTTYWECFFVNEPIY